MIFTSVVLLLSSQLIAANPSSSSSSDPMDRYGGMDLFMGSTDLEHHRTGAVSIFKYETHIDDCSFESHFLEPQTIEFKCTTTSTANKDETKTGTPEGNKQNDEADITSVWEWCGFRWHQPTPDALNMDLFRCGSGEDFHSIVSTDPASTLSEENQVELTSFLASPVASHFVHFSIVSGAHGHDGLGSIAMLQIHHLAMSFAKITAKQEFDTSEWYNGGDFSELLAFANERYAGPERRTEEDIADEFRDKVVRPAEDDARERRLGGCSRIDIDQPVDKCGNRCYGRCGPGCDCWKSTCGDCSAHRGCWEHDCYCSCMSTATLGCLTFRAHPATCSFAGCAAAYCGKNNVYNSKKKYNCGGNCSCFSGDMKVQVQDRGYVQMKHLRLGDKILAANGKYENVYSFGHISRDTESEFVQIKTASSLLELSRDHMVYLVNKAHPVPASQVNVGDVLKVLNDNENTPGEEEGLVREISTIKRKGFFAPLTSSGTIVVNDIVASTYTSVSKQRDGSYKSSLLELGGVEILSNQGVAHIWETPSRIVRTVMGWKEETYVMGESYSPWAYFGLRLAKDILLPWGIFGKLVVSLIVLGILPLYGAEWLVRSFVPVVTGTANASLDLIIVLSSAAMVSLFVVGTTLSPRVYLQLKMKKN